MKHLTSLLLALLVSGGLWADDEMPICEGESLSWKACTYYTDDGYKYSGPWKDGKATGYGASTFANGATYVGEFKDFKKEGLGTLTLTGGASYRGEWKNDKKEGVGLYTWSDGSKYFGEYLNDNKHGLGYYSEGDGFWYGEWIENKAHKKLKYDLGGEGTKVIEGTLYWYIGDYQDDKFDGYGITFSKKTGEVYKGESKNSKRHGQGILYYGDGRKYIGDWVENVRNGYGSFYYAKGDIYQGFFEDDKKQGKGLCRLAESTLEKMERGKLRRPENLKKGQSIFECQHENDELVYAEIPGNWLSKFASGFVEGLTENLAEDLVGAAIEGAVLGSMMEPCIPEVKVKTSQTIPGAPQYGTKTRTTIKPCASAYQFK